MRMGIKEEHTLLIGEGFPIHHATAELRPVLRRVDGIGVDNVNEVGDTDVLQSLACSRKKVASHLVPVYEAPSRYTTYDFSGKDV